MAADNTNAANQTPANLDSPQPPRDAYAAGLYQQYGLNEAPTLAQISQVAIPLLSSPNTVLVGMSLVLGRQVDAQELKDDQWLGRAMLLAPPNDKFVILVMKKRGDPAEQQPPPAKT